MIQAIHRQTVKARKEYYDDGWEFIDEWIRDGCCVGSFSRPRKITFAEGRILVSHRRRLQPQKIFKGDIYERQFNEYDGDTFTFRMNKALFEIACKYDLFPEL